MAMQGAEPVAKLNSTPPPERFRRKQGGAPPALQSDMLTLVVRATKTEQNSRPLIATKLAEVPLIAP